MAKLILRWAVVAVAIWIAILIVPGIHADPRDWTTIAAMGLILGLMNALVRPLLKFLSCPLIILTLGLFILVLNALVFWLAGWVSEMFGLGFTLENFWAAFFGALVVSIVSGVLSIFLHDDRDKKKKD
ncbi:MAG: phage holin family protein [Chloroflexi bacterium]|nr:phage holin family protein [Chloroflexota bacterium]